MKQFLRKAGQLMLFCCTFLGLNNDSRAQVVLSESFDANQFLPTGWAGDGPTSFWVRRTNGTFPNCTPHTGNAMARFSSHTAPADTAQTIVSPVIDYSSRGTSDAPLSFWMYRDTALSSNFDSIQVLFNTSPTLSGAIALGTIARCASIAIPDTQASSGWYQYTFLAPQGFTGTTNYFLFKGYSSLGNHMYLDDVSWTAFPDLCDGTESSGTLSATLNMLCNGGGTTVLSSTGYSSGSIGLSYLWQSATTLDGPWSDMGSNPASQNSGTLNTNTYFRMVTGCSITSTADTSEAFLVSVSTNPTPSISLSATTIAYCNGSSNPAVVTASGGVSYTWLPAGAVTSATGDTLFAMPTSATQFTVTGSDEVGCQATATVNVTLSNPPTIVVSATPSTICEGDSALIRVQVQGGGPGGGQNTYAWDNGQSTTAFYDSPIADATYQVTVTNAAGCSTSGSVSATVLPAMASSFTYIQDGATFTFENTSSGDTASLWMFGDGNGSFVSNPVYNFNASGSYTVTLINYGPCGSDTSTSVIEVALPNGLTSFSRSDVQLIPNPATAVVQVSFTATQNETLLRIMDFTGRIVQQHKLNTQPGQIAQSTLTLDELAKGAYWVQIVDSRTVRSHTLIRQ